MRGADLLIPLAGPATNGRTPGARSAARRAALLAVFWLCSSAAAGPPMLLKFRDRGPAGWRPVAAELKAHGGRVLAVYPPGVMLAEVDAAVAGQLVDRGTLSAAWTGPVGRRPGGSLSEGAGVRLWNRALAGDRLEFLEPAAEALDQACVQSMPSPEVLESTSGEPPVPTSAFLAGSVVVGAILPESNGLHGSNVENWTAAEVTAVHDRIVTALGRLRDHCPIAEIIPIFHFDQAPAEGAAAGTIDCDYESVHNTGAALSNVLQRLGYEGNPSTAAYARHLRNLHDSDWAFFFLVIDNSVSGGGQAMALLGGPFAQCYASSSAGVFQHEAGHIFNAADEYGGAAKSPTGLWGYLQVVHANSAFNDGTGYHGGAGEFRPALMLDTSNWPSAYTAAQFGWYDSDADGILDVCDTFPEVQVAVQSIRGGRATLNGEARVTALMDQRDPAVRVSTTRIAGVEWRLAGLSPWQPIAAFDGAYDGPAEPLALTLPALPGGAYDVEVAAVNDRGNRTAVPAQVHVEISAGVADAAPWPVLAAHPPRQRAGYAVALDASGSGDLETAPADLQFRWDFEGDGAWDTPWDASPHTTHHYPAPGMYAATVEVLDAAGQSAAASAEVLIASANLEPVARLSVSSRSVHGHHSPAFQFDAGASHDPEGGPLKVRWDFDGDGVFDTAESSTLSIEYTYTLAGIAGLSNHWNVAAELRDTEGATALVTRHIWSCPYNHPPHIEGVLRPESASTATQVIFDLNATSDPDRDTSWDGLLQFRYDWDGDLNWDTPFIDAAVQLHTYASPGVFRPRVQVRDRFHALDEIAFELHVGDEPVQQPFIVTAGSLTPPQERVAPGDALQFEAQWEYIGAPGDLSARWQVDGIDGGDPRVGTVNQDGLYIAGSQLGEHLVSAVSWSNPSVHPTATVSVETDFIEIAPAEFELHEGQTLQFTAHTGHPDAAIEWFVNRIPGGHPLLATLDADGLLTVPDDLSGEHSVFVRARLADLPGVSATSAGTVRSTMLPEADFTASITRGPAPLTVDFTALPTHPVDRWSWSFDDGTTVVGGPAVRHSFAEPGLYTVGLTVRGPGGTAHHAKTAFIHAEGGGAPLVDFFSGTVNIAPCQQAPCTAPAFLPVTAGTIHSYHWNLGGVHSSTQPVAAWPSPPPGVHDISVTVQGPGGSTTKFKPDYFAHWPGPAVDFMTLGSTVGSGSLIVEFVPLPSEVPCSYTWDFGDGETSSSPNPTHVFYDDGPHTVTLTVVMGNMQDANPCGVPTHLRIGRIARENLVHVLPPPPCASDADCDDADPCTFDECAGRLCVHVRKSYGDVNADGVVDKNDLDCLLEVYAGQPACATGNTSNPNDEPGRPGDPHPLRHADLAPCTGDGVIDLNDLLAMLSILAGDPPCTCPPSQ